MYATSKDADCELAEARFELAASASGVLRGTRINVSRAGEREALDARSDFFRRRRCSSGNS